MGYHNGDRAHDNSQHLKNDAKVIDIVPDVTEGKCDKKLSRITFKTVRKKHTKKRILDDGTYRLFYPRFSCDQCNNKAELMLTVGDDRY